MKAASRYFLAAALPLVLLACASLPSTETEPESGGEPDAGALVDVKGVELRPGDVATELQLFTEDLRASSLASTKNLQTLVTQIAFRRRMSAIAEASGELEDEHLQALLRRGREEILARWVPQQVAESLDYPDFSERARRYYEENLAEYTSAEERRLAQIMIQAGSEAERVRRKGEIIRIYRRLQSGEAFAELAEKFSEDASRHTRGDLGSIKRGQTYPEFEEVAFSLDSPGETSTPFETRAGWHIVRLIDKAEQHVTPFDEVKDQIVQELRREYHDEAMRAWFQEQIPRSAVEVPPEELKALLDAMRDKFGMQAVVEAQSGGEPSPATAESGETAVAGALEEGATGTSGAVSDDGR